MNFVNAARKKSLVDPGPVDFLEYQIIMTDSPHKFTLMHREDCDEQTLKKVEQAIRDRFMVESRTTYNELWKAQQTVAELPVKNFGENISKFDELRDHMMSNGNLVKSIRTPIIERDAATLREYITPKITHKNDFALDVEDIIKDVISCSHGGTTNVVVVNIVGNKGVVNVNTHDKEREQKSAPSRAWIKANLPVDREYSAEYRKRYETACIAHKIESEGIQLMSKYIKTFGYKIKHNNSRNYWVKIV